MTDADGDHWGDDHPAAGVVAGQDCDDGRATVHPGAAEVWYDGIDQDCDASTGWDRDGDGYDALAAPGGTDCDDLHADAHPGGVEVANDGIDQDCDGHDLVQCPRGTGGVFTPYGSCSEVRADNCPTGLYWIRTDPTASAGYQTRCDMSHDGGGWTLVGVVSDDRQDTWTWTWNYYWADNVAEFGAVTALDHDYRNRGFAQLRFRDVMFVHAPSGVWAAYHGVGDGTQSLGAFIVAFGARYAATCWAGRSGYPMSAGTLTTAGPTGGLCTTDLYISPQDQDGDPLLCHPSGGRPQDTYGPAWSANVGAGCPLSSPGFFSGLGPSGEVGEADVERAAMGFGLQLGLNTGASGRAENFMRIFVR